MGVLVIAALVFGPYISAPDFWKLPLVEVRDNSKRLETGSTSLRR